MENDGKDLELQLVNKPHPGMYNPMLLVSMMCTTDLWNISNQLEGVMDSLQMWVCQLKDSLWKVCCAHIWHEIMTLSFQYLLSLSLVMT